MTGPDLGESNRYINVFADLCLTNGYPDWQLRAGCRQKRHDSEWPKAVFDQISRFHRGVQCPSSRSILCSWIFGDME